MLGREARPRRYTRAAASSTVPFGMPCRARYRAELHCRLGEREVLVAEGLVHAEQLHLKARIGPQTGGPIGGGGPTRASGQGSDARATDQRRSIQPRKTPLKPKGGAAAWAGACARTRARADVRAPAPRASRGRRSRARLESHRVYDAALPARAFAPAEGSIGPQGRSARLALRTSHSERKATSSLTIRFVGIDTRSHRPRGRAAAAQPTD